MGQGKNVRRGEVYLVDASAHGGSLRKRRPALVVQNDIANRHARDTIVAAIRDAHGGRLLPVFVPLKKGSGGVEKDSVLDAGHIVTVPQEALVRRLGSLPPGMMDEVDRALRVSLGLRG